VPLSNSDNSFQPSKQAATTPPPSKPATPALPSKLTVHDPRTMAVTPLQGKLYIYSIGFLECCY